METARDSTQWIDRSVPVRFRAALSKVSRRSALLAFGPAARAVCSGFQLDCKAGATNPPSVATIAASEICREYQMAFAVAISANEPPRSISSGTFRCWAVSGSDSSDIPGPTRSPSARSLARLVVARMNCISGQRPNAFAAISAASIPVRCAPWMVEYMSRDTASPAKNRRSPIGVASS